MSYIGSTPTSQNFTSGTDYFSGTGSQTAFTLTRTVNSVNDIEVVINNVVQQPSTAYTLSGTTITFTSAPSSGTNNIYVRYLATNMQSFTVPANSISRTHLDSNLQAGFQGRNKIINGSFLIDQRRAGASYTPTGGDTYVCDRWGEYISQASKLTFQQQSASVSATNGFTTCMGVTVASAVTIGASDYFTLFQRIEGYNIADLAWGTANAKTITISFQVYASVTGTYGGSVTNSAYNRSYPFTYTVNSANTWETKTITIAGDTSGTWLTNNGIGIELGFSFGTGSSASGTAGAWTGSWKASATGATSMLATAGATWYITGVQLEEGTTATSFERENYTVTDMKCKRYYLSYTVASTCTSWSVNSTQNLAIGFPVTMRATPTYKGILSGAWSGNTPAENYNCKDGYTWYHASYFYGNGSLVVGFEAEL